MFRIGTALFLKFAETEHFWRISAYIWKWKWKLLSSVRLFVTPWTAEHQASLSFTISQNLLKLMSIELVMSSNHLILCYPLLLLSSIFPNIRVFSNDLAVHIRRPKYWSFSFSISPSNEYSGFKSLLSHTKKKNVMAWKMKSEGEMYAQPEALLFICPGFAPVL